MLSIKTSVVLSCFIHLNLIGSSAFISKFKKFIFFKFKIKKK
jgi:hypothetical protein